MFKHISTILLLVFFFLLVLATSASAADPIGSMLQGVMIWDAVDASSPISPTSIGFRKKITVSKTFASAALHIFADTRYLLWINGTYVARGPNRFDPKRPEYDTLNVSKYLDRGEITLAVLVQSRLSNYRFINHRPGLGLLLETKGRDGHVLDRFATDATWRSSASTRFGPVPISWKRGTGGQLAFECTVPDGVTADFSIPLPSAAPTLMIDGRLIDRATVRGRFLSTELPSGKHNGRIQP